MKATRFKALKSNPTDLTLLNLRALKKQIEAMGWRLDKLESRVKAEKKKAGK